MSAAALAVAVLAVSGACPVAPSSLSEAPVGVPEETTSVPVSSTYPGVSPAPLAGSMSAPEGALMAFVAVALGWWWRGWVSGLHWELDQRQVLAVP